MGIIEDSESSKLSFSWNLDINEINIVRSLGSGGFGSVYEAKYKDVTVALKQLHTNTKNKKAAMQSFRAETRPEVLSLNHQNIVKTLGVSSASSLDDKPFFIMEFISTKTLLHILHDHNEVFDDSRRIEVAYQISQGMTYIHQNGLVHLDLKPANVLMTNDGICKIADFGCCQYIEDRPNTPTRSYLTGTFAYRAPELLKGEDPSYKADVFSLGILLWQLLSREIPYKLQNHQVVIFRVVSCNLRPTIPTGCNADNKYIDLMTSAWAGNPDNRPTMGDIAYTFENWR